MISGSRRVFGQLAPYSDRLRALVNNPFWPFPPARHSTSPSKVVKLYFCSFSLWAQLDDSRPWKYFSKVQTCQEGFARIAGVLRLAR